MTTTETVGVYELAHMAGCAHPDRLTSPGAKWLLLIAADYACRPDEFADGDVQDNITEAADSIVPISTYDKWQVFVDLAAYQEDVEELGPIEDMDKGASVALYMIAERLYTALVEARPKES